MNPLVVLSALVAVASAAPAYGGLVAAPGYGFSGLATAYAAAPGYGYAAAPHAIAYSNVNAAVPAPLYDNGQSPGLGALVKKTAITAAGRPVTTVNSHITRTVPEVTYKQVDVAVPVPRPVAVRRPVPYAAPYPVTPVIESTEVVQPIVHAAPVAYAGPAAYAAHGYGYAAPSAYAAHGYGYAAPHGYGYSGLAAVKAW